MAKSSTNRQAKIFILITSIVMFSVLVRFSPIIDYSPEPIAYAGGAYYGINYAMDTGHFLSPAEAESKIYSPEQGGSNIFAGSLIESAEHPISPMLSISVLKAAGLEQSTWQTEIATSLIYTFPILFIAYSILNSISKKRDDEQFNSRLPIIYLGIGLLYSQLASTALVSQQGSFGWIFFLYPIYFLLIRRAKEVRFRVISLLFLALLPAAYFTGASFALLWFSIIVLPFWRGREDNRAVWRVFLFFGLFYVLYSIFISLGRTQILANIGENLIDTFKSGFPHSEPTYLVLPSEYLSSGTSLLNKMKNLTAAIFVAAPVVFFLIRSAGKRSDHFTGERTVVAGIIALPIMTLLLFVWLGALGIGRIPEYGSVISVICIACLIPTMKKQRRKFIASIAVLAILSSTYVYVTDENIANRFITTSEDGAAKWLMSTSDSEKTIFTDQRLTGVFVASGFLNATGVYEKGSVNETINELNAIYYGNDIYQSIRVISQMNCSYLFFSEQMTKETPSIFGYNYHFKPSPSNFIEKYMSNANFIAICDNGKATVLALE